jgi:hypothetical protein
VPYSSISRSVAMISDSASVSTLQSCPALSIAVDITAIPRDSAGSYSVLGAVPVVWSSPQLAPWVTTSL